MEGEQLAYDRFSAAYQRQLADDRYHCLVYEQDRAVAGVLNLRFEEQLHHAACVAEIMEFAIDGAHRRQGIGSEMLAEACRIAAARGCIQIEAACNQLRTEAHRFYLREGLHNFHFKFSKSLTGEDPVQNRIGR